MLIKWVYILKKTSVQVVQNFYPPGIIKKKFSCFFPTCTSTHTKHIYSTHWKHFYVSLLKHTQLHFLSKWIHDIQCSSEFDVPWTFLFALGFSLCVHAFIPSLLFRPHFPPHLSCISLFSPALFPVSAPANQLQACPCVLPHVPCCYVCI